MRTFVRAHRVGLIGAGIGLVLLIAGVSWLWAWAGSYESTDDAQVDGHIASLSSRIAGTVTSVPVQENQQVRAGTLLVQLDPRDYQVTLAYAEAQLANAQGQRVSDRDAARAAIRQAQANRMRAQNDAERMRYLLKLQAATKADYDARIAAARSASATLDTARAQDLSVEGKAREAAIAAARANVERARLDLEYTRVYAPTDGVIGRRYAEPGEHVNPGTELVSFVDLRDLWVTANFKETQLRRMKPGLRARVHVDSLDRDYQATLESFGGASGSRFSVLPPENATGNYVKVVQRIPMRVRIDPGQPEMERLRPGMSVEVKVFLK